MTAFDWEEVRRRIVAKGFSEDEAVRAVAFMADGVRETQMRNASMIATKSDFKEFERRLTARFALMYLLWVLVLTMSFWWLL